VRGPDEGLLGNGGEERKKEKRDGEKVRIKMDASGRTYGRHAR